MDRVIVLILTVVSGTVAWVLGASYGAEQMETQIIRQCNETGEYNAQTGDAYITCNMED